MIVALAAIFIGFQTPTMGQLQAIYDKWDKGVVAHDLKAMRSVLAETFMATQTGGKRPLNRDQFLKQISDGWKSDAPQEKSFITLIKKIEKKGEKLKVSVSETIIFARVDNKGREFSFSSIDTWQKFNGKWQVVATEPLVTKKRK